jgi:dimethylaniline monooxygenase (N-oxide forming)
MLYDVIIVGAGFSGIYTLKHCLEEGLKVLLLEKSPELGGVWNIKNKPGGVHEFTYSVTSKLYLSATDYPPPDDWPEFPNASLVYDYLMDYIHHFNLEPHILTNIHVQDVERVNDIWTLRGSTDVVWKSNHVVIATGVNSCPMYPKDMVFKNFQGPTMHAHDYTSQKNDYFVNKNVLVIGGSDTACDIAMQLCEKANKTYVSIRNGQWFQDRHFGAESPADMFYSRIVDWFIKHIYGKNHVHRGFGEKEIFQWWGKGGSDIDIWTPKCDYLNSYYNKSRDIIRMVAKGRIIPTGRVHAIEGHMVSCDGVTDAFPVDIILYATGYNYIDCTPFLKDTLQQLRYKRIFPITTDTQGNYTYDQIALVGYIRPYLTSIPMLIELQSRLVAKVFSGQVALPSPNKMMQLAIRDKELQQKEFPCHSERIPFLVDPYDYSNDIAKQIKATPNYIHIWMNDPFLGYCLLGDSWNPFAYRLNDSNNEKKQIAIDQIKAYHSHKTSIKIRGVMFFYIYKFSIILIILLIVLYTGIRWYKRRRY